MRPFLALSKLLAIPVLAAFALACGDDVTDPGAFADSAEAAAVLRSAAALPALPAVIDVAGTPESPALRATLFRASELWASGITADHEVARAHRRLAVRYAAPALVAELAPEEWAAVDRGLREWSVTAREMMRHISLPAVEARLEAAARHLDGAERAEDTTSRAMALLLAGADLIETTPAFVARSLAASADEAVTSARANPDGITSEDLARAERLKDWAARAIEEGEDLLAIHRAYYALQLVEAQ